MLGNVLLATVVLFVTLVLWLMQELSFLAPYRTWLIERYGGVIAGFAGLLFINLFALIGLLCRKLLLKDTGRKLAHLEKQLRTGESVSEELSRRLRE